MRVQKRSIFVINFFTSFVTPFRDSIIISFFISAVKAIKNVCHLFYKKSLLFCNHHFVEKATTQLIIQVEAKNESKIAKCFDVILRINTFAENKTIFKCFSKDSQRK